LRAFARTAGALLAGGLGLATAAALVVVCRNGGSPLASPETQVRESLARSSRAHLDRLGPAGAASVRLETLRWEEPAVSVEGRRATVAAMVDAGGTVSWDGNGAELRYLGRERFAMTPCAGGWCAEEPLPRLRGVLDALLARDAARRDGGAVRAWQVRVERDHAEVGEDRIGPAGEVERTVDRLEWTGDRWAFAAR
jgi:hypothetical protein